MNIEQAKPTLVRQRISGRTPNGMPINDYALEVLNISIEDTGNHHIEFVQCQNPKCGFVISMLLTEGGCPNCGVENFSTTMRD